MGSAKNNSVSKFNGLPEAERHKILPSQRKQLDVGKGIPWNPLPGFPASKDAGGECRLMYGL